MFSFIKRLWAGDLAIANDVLEMTRLHDAVVSMPMNDARDEAFRLLPVSDAFDVFEPTQAPDGVRLPRAATEFLNTYSHIVCCDGEVEINASHIAAWLLNSSDVLNFVVLGQTSHHGFYLLLDVNTDQVYELHEEDSEYGLSPFDALPSVFHWIVYKGRLSILKP